MTKKWAMFNEFMGSMHSPSPITPLVQDSIEKDKLRIAMQFRKKYIKMLVDLT